MAAPHKWVEEATEVFLDEVDREKALAIVDRLRAIPATNGSLIETLRRIEAALRAAPSG